MSILPDIRFGWRTLAKSSSAESIQASTPGAAVIVVRHGQVLLDKGYGLADVARRVPITPRTAFDIASVSKPFTAMAVLMLVESGKLHYTE